MKFNGAKHPPPASDGGGPLGKNRDFHISHDPADENESVSVLFDENLIKCRDILLDSMLKIRIEKV